MPTSGSILSNDITLNSQKVVYIHQFKVMAKAVQKIEVIFVWARHCGVALMTRTLYHRYISGRSGGVYTLPPPWRPSPIGPVPAARGHFRPARHCQVALMTRTFFHPYISYTHVSKLRGVWPAFIPMRAWLNCFWPRKFEVLFKFTRHY